VLKDYRVEHVIMEKAFNGRQANQRNRRRTAPPIRGRRRSPRLTGILGQVQGNLGNTGVTGAENNALNTMQANAGNYATQLRAADQATMPPAFLNGGGATDQAGNVNQNYQRYVEPDQPARVEHEL
jgi:hypothetical protein